MPSPCSSCSSRFRSLACSTSKGDPASVQIFPYFLPDFTERVGRMNRCRINHHGALAIGRMRSSIKNLPRYLRTSRGSGLFGVPVFASSTPIRVASNAVIATVSKLQLRKQEGGCCKPPDATCLHANTLPNAIELRNPPDGVPAPWGAASLPATRTLPFPLRYGRDCEMPADRARQQGHR